MQQASMMRAGATPKQAQARSNTMTAASTRAAGDLVVLGILVNVPYPTDVALSTAFAAAKGAKYAKGADYAGGAYKDLAGTGRGLECHHCPSNAASPLSKGDGPAIQMDPGDHRQTASWGNSREARDYRSRQGEMIEGGDFKGAQQMDVDDIQSKFGNKYDDAIQQMQRYTDELDP